MVTILPNPRGSTGFGRAFQAANHRDLGGIQFAVVRKFNHTVACSLLVPEHELSVQCCPIRGGDS